MATANMIAGKVWNDSDEDTVFDIGDEAGIEGVIVAILDGVTGAVIGTTTTDSEGDYSFELTTSGLINVTFSHVAGNAGPEFTTTEDGSGITTVNYVAETGVYINGGVAPYDESLAYIGDTVWADENGNGFLDEGETGVDGVKVVLKDDEGEIITSTTTANGGDYQFVNVADGTYTLEFEAPVGKVFTARAEGGNLGQDNYSKADENGKVAVSITGVDSNIIDVGLVDAPTGSISGLAWSDDNGDGTKFSTGIGELGIQGVTVNLIGDDEMTVVQTVQTVGGSDGRFIFENVVDGDYYVEFVAPDGKTFTSKSEVAPGDSDTDSDVDPTSGRTALLTVANAADLTNISAGVVDLPGSVSGSVWIDADKDGVRDEGETAPDGVQVELLDAGGDVSGTTTTAAGIYSFANVIPGSYKIRFTAPEGMVFTTATEAEPGADATDSDADTTTGETELFTVSPDMTASGISAGFFAEGDTGGGDTGGGDTGGGDTGGGDTGGGDTGGGDTGGGDTDGVSGPNLITRLPGLTHETNTATGVTTISGAAKGSLPDFLDPVPALYTPDNARLDARIDIDGGPTIFGGNLNDNIGGGAGTQKFHGMGGEDNLTGLSGKDSLFGGGSSDDIGGGKNADLIRGGQGDDKSRGGLGNDTIDGGAGNDNSVGGGGDDVVNSSGGDDRAYGGAGDDTVRGGNGRDLVVGSEGDDLIIGGRGNDVLYGGEGSDVFRFNEGDGKDYIHVFSTVSPNHDRIEIRSGAKSFDDLDITSKGAGVLISYGDSGDTIKIGNIIGELSANDFIF